MCALLLPMGLSFCMVWDSDYIVHTPCIHVEAAIFLPHGRGVCITNLMMLRIIKWVMSVFFL